MNIRRCHPKHVGVTFAAESAYSRVSNRVNLLTANFEKVTKPSSHKRKGTNPVSRDPFSVSLYLFFSLLFLADDIQCKYLRTCPATCHCPPIGPRGYFKTRTFACTRDFNQRFSHHPRSLFR